MDGIRMVSGIVVGFIGIDLETDPVIFRHMFVLCLTVMI